MNILELTVTAIRSLMSRPLRTGLTLIGIFIGIASVVALVSLGQGLTNAIQGEFMRSGGDKLVIMPKNGGFGPPGSLSAGRLTSSDISTVEHVHGISQAAGIILKPVTITFNNHIQTQMAFTLPEDQSANLVIEADSIEAESGRILRHGDPGNAMIGHDIATDTTYFGKAITIGNTILINNTPFKVVGVLKRKGDPGFDRGVLVTENSLRPLVNLGSDELSMIYARTSAGRDPEQLDAPVLHAISRSRNEKEGFETIEVQTFTEILQAFASIFAIIQSVLVGISMISLVVGSVGIMNTMYTSVVERTREIGIMKSIGATNFQVLTIFFFESALLGFLGGVLGALAGAGISTLIQIGAAQRFGSPLIRAAFPPWLFIGVILLSTILGILAGVLPARQASNHKPVEALRYD